jgi:transposase
MGKDQLHKRFTDEQVKMLLQWYEVGSLTEQQVCERLQIGRSRFFTLFQKYKKNPADFTVRYRRSSPAPNRCDRETDAAVFAELERQKTLIKNPNLPIHYYHYREARDAVRTEHGITLSDETVRRRAIEWGFTNPKMKKQDHDRTVETTAVRQLFQHDASVHLWSPFASEKWHLLTTIDDFSRLLLYAVLSPEETTWAHIQAAQHVITTYGRGVAYYVDNHRIFRFISYRDSIWRCEVKGTDDVDTEWKRCVKDAGMDVWYASSPQAKGKIERPYRWLQERMVIRYAKQEVKTISEAQRILDQLVTIYNEQWVHATTKEIPRLRYERALREGASVLLPFTIPEPYTSTKDIFCLRDTRIIDGYRKVNWKKYEFTVPKSVPIGASVELHVIPDAQQPEIRVWYRDRVVHIVRLHR